MNKILLVDDDYAIRLLYQEELTYEGYEVITASGGVDLLEIIARHRPDLIVLDIKMKEVNGLELLQDIRNTYYYLPVILCTVYPSFRYNPKSIAADYHVVKSSDLNELKLKIKMVIKGKTQFPESTTPEEINEANSPRLIRDEVKHDLQN